MRLSIKFFCDKLCIFHKILPSDAKPAIFKCGLCHRTCHTQCNGLTVENVAKRGRNTKLACCWCMVKRVKRGDGYFGGVIEKPKWTIVLMGKFVPGMYVYFFR